jgi:hypothetical protein
MSFLDAMDVYFRGEKTVGMAVVPVGLLLGVAAVWLIRWYGGGFGKGMGIPLAVAGAVMVIGGPLLVRTVNARGDRLTEVHGEDAAAPVVEEAARMKKVNASWPLLKTAWTVLIVVALLLLFAVRKEWVQGLALAFLVLATTVMVVDVFAERRARVYTEQLHALGSW